MVQCHQRNVPEGAYYDLGLVDARVLTDLRTPAFLPGDEEPATHYIFRVRLKGSGEDFAIDIANAKYGHYDTVVPWDTYLSQRVSRIIRGNITPSFSATFVPPEPHLCRIIALSEFNTFRMKHLIESWLERNHLSYGTFASLSKPRFAEELANLEGFAASGLRESYLAATRCANLVAEIRFSNERGGQDGLQRERLALMTQNGVLQAAQDTDRPFLFGVN